jgi:hypothetical protein
LLSYVYRNSEKEFSIWWNELLKIHLAGLPSQNSAIQSREVPEIESHLTTYADQTEVKTKEKILFLHLTDTTERLGGDLNVKTLLPSEGKKENLFSYAYEKQEEQWSEYWTQTMNIHLAGHSATSEMESEIKTEHSNYLTTYADQIEVRNTIGAITDRIPDLRPRVIIDSGAFTAFTTGKTIDPRDYAKWSIEFKERWKGKMTALHFMNLDVIGDQDASWSNQSINH